jgi:hypothetical protein
MYVGGVLRAKHEEVIEDIYSILVQAAPIYGYIHKRAAIRERYIYGIIYMRKQLPPNAAGAGG